MKKKILLPTLIMFLAYILWNISDSVYFLYYYPELERLYIFGNLLRLIPAIILCALFIFIQVKIENRYSSRRNLLLIASVINSIIITFIDSVVISLIHKYLYSGDIDFYLKNCITPFSRWILFYFGSSLFLYFVSYHRKSAEQELQLKLTKALADEAQLMMLRYQINPHFLFNALNTIQANIQTDQQQAKNLVGELAEFFRYSLSKTDRVYVSLKEEINTLKNYLSIQKARFGDSLSISFDIDESVLEKKIPFFIIHPLVENAIKYGFSMKLNKLILIIRVEQIENGILILIKNSGSLKNDSKNALPEYFSTKTGIENIKTRLSLLYPNAHEFSLYEQEGFVNAQIKIFTNGKAL